MPRWLILILTLVLILGCEELPKRANQPVIFNPFPQLRRVAIAPFFNQSQEPTVDGERFATAYFNELQATPGFEVVPVPVVVQAMRQNGITMSKPNDARRLAQLLDVDAVVVGSVTDYSPYYPPRLGLHVEWWSANPNYAEIPAGYGLPWGTSEEEFIPDSLAYEAELSLARDMMKSQSPPYTPEATPEEEIPNLMAPPATMSPVAPRPAAPQPLSQPPALETLPDGASRTAYESNKILAARDRQQGSSAKNGENIGTTGATGVTRVSGETPVLRDSAVLRHTRIYNGNNGDFATAYANYESFQDDLRAGGVPARLQRSEDFIRFCCHMHIDEMLSARGGAGKTRVVWQYPCGR